MIYDQALICKAHGYAIANLTGHLADTHNELDLKIRKAIVGEYFGFQINRPPDYNFQFGPRNSIPAIDGLTIRNGFACKNHEKCGYLTINRKAIRVHCNEEHDWTWTKADPVHWVSVKLQSFFTVPGNAIHYFCVVVPEEAGEDVTDKRGRPKCQLIDDIKEQWAHEKEQQEVLADGASRHETTNWMKRAGWIAHFKERDLSEIHACSRMPGPEDDYLRRMAAAMDRLFFGHCIDGLKSMRHAVEQSKLDIFMQTLRRSAGRPL